MFQYALVSQIIECLYKTEPFALRSKPLRFLSGWRDFVAFLNDARIILLLHMDKARLWDHCGTISSCIYLQAITGLKEYKCVRYKSI